MADFDFSSVYVKEASKKLLRSTVEMLVKDAAEQGLSNFDIAGCLMRGARKAFQGENATDLKIGWWADSRKTFIYLHDNGITTREEIMTQIADRNLNARKRD